MNRMVSNGLLIVLLCIVMLILYCVIQGWVWLTKEQTQVGWYCKKCFTKMSMRHGRGSPFACCECRDVIQEVDRKRKYKFIIDRWVPLYVNVKVEKHNLKY